MGVAFQCGQFALATSGATQDFTIGGETRTPVAAWFHFLGNTTASTSQAPLIQSFGATDGTNEWCGTIYSEDGAIVSDCYTDPITTGVIEILDATGAVDGLLSYNSFIAGGVRLNHDNNPGAAYLGNIWFFFEGDYQVGTVTTGSTAGVATDEAVSGFSPTFLLVQEFGGHAFDGGVQASCNASLGFVADNGGALQATSCWFDRDNVVTTEATAITDNAHGSGWITQTAVGGGERYTTYAFTTAGFSATPVHQNVTHHIGYIAGNIDGMAVWAGHLSFPNATGAHSFTEPGLEGTYGLICQTALANESHTTGASVEGWGAGMYTQATQLSGCGSSDDNRNAAVNNTLTRSFTTNTLWNLQAPPGTGALVASWTASTSSGFDASVSAVAATARLQPALIFEPFPDTYAIDETLGLTEQVAILGGASLDDGMGIVEDTPAAVYISLGETVGLTEDPQAVGSAAVDETLGLTEEVDSFAVFSPSPSSSSGQGGNTGLQAGEGGNAGVEVGGG